MKRRMKLRLLPILILQLLVVGLAAEDRYVG